jgi:hypothetical protein
MPGRGAKPVVAWGLSAAALALLAAAWCHAQGPPAAEQAGLQRADFTLDGVGYRILLPPRARVGPPGASGISIRDETKSQRLERMLILDVGPHGQATASRRTITFRSGATLSYSVDDNVGGGSGGPVAELTGEITVGGRRLAVTCTDQNEHRREPDWCVAYLHHLEIERQ